jgi:hypothetical protein
MIAIVKISQTKFLKYHVNNLMKFTQFLDATYPEWRWYNVFDKKTKTQLGNFTKTNRPTAAKINL